MNLKEIKEIVNSGLPEDIQRQSILEIISKDEKAIPMILETLQTERKNKKEMILDMNMELSRAHIYIDERSESRKEAKEHFNKSFVVDKIAEFYIKYKNQISHCFNRFN